MTAATDMVERVARAIAWKRETFWIGHDDDDRSAIIEQSWPKYEVDARAAVEAMREPTEGMREALLELWASDDKEKQALHYGVAWTAYRAMIDAALGSRP